MTLICFSIDSNATCEGASSCKSPVTDPHRASKESGLRFGCRPLQRASSKLASRKADEEQSPVPVIVATAVGVLNNPSIYHAQATQRHSAEAENFKSE